jgi:hypothetical protein
MSVDYHRTRTTDCSNRFELMIVLSMAFSIRFVCQCSCEDIYIYISQYLSIIKNVEVVELQVDGHWPLLA